MSLGTKIERTMKGSNLEKRCWFSPNRNTVQSLDLGLLYMDGKLRHRPKTFMGVQDLKRLFSSPTFSNNGEVRIYPAAQTLFSIQPISRLLEVQMNSSIIHEINSSKFWPIKRGIYHVFRYLGVQIKIMLLFPLFIFCNA